MREPPGWALALIRRTVPERDRANVLEGMEELYRHRARRHGVRDARRWYGRHALEFAWRMTLHGAGKRLRSYHGEGTMGDIAQELAHAGRRLTRARLFSAVAVVTVAVGIGAFASIYAVVDGVLMEPPGYDAPDRLVYVWRDYWFDLDRGWMGGPDIANLRSYDDVFEDVVALRMSGANLAGGTGEAALRTDVMLASAGLFDVLGVAPMLGRGFAPGEDAPGGPEVAVLSHALWSTRFAGDASVVGRDIFLDGAPVRVLGVMPPDFHFVEHQSLGPPVGADLWMPLQEDLASLNPGSGLFAALARVREGVPPAQVDAAVAAVAEILDEQFGNRGLELWTVPLSDDLLEEVRPSLWALLASASFLLLVLAMNLATLFIGRAALRRRDLAVQAALGAGGRRLMFGVLAEGVVLAAAGSAFGLALATGGIEAIRRWAPADLPRLWAVELDVSVFLASVGVALAMLLGASLAPALAARAGGLSARLREAGRGGGGRSERTRSVLVVAQIALSLALLVSAGLVGRAFADLLQADPGFDGAGTLTFEVPLDPVHYPDDDAVVEFEGRFRSAVASLPGVTAVGVTSSLPLSASASQQGTTFPGAPGNSGREEEDQILADVVRAGPGYTEAVGLRLRSGRAFDEGDGAPDRRLVAIIDDVLADRFFPGADPLGAPVAVFGDTAWVVGVVDQARLYDVHSDGRGQLYLPFARNAVSTPRVVVRGGGSSSTLTPALREVLHGLDAGVPMSAVRPMDRIVREAVGQERLSVTLLSVFALGSVLLAALGIYGVVSNAVTRRRHEMGVRMALGADRNSVVGMVVRQGIVLAVLGAAVGLALTRVVAPALDTVVFGFRPSDPWVYGGVIMGLVSVTVLASIIPAVRATRIDPVEALRGE